MFAICLAPGMEPPTSRVPCTLGPLPLTKRFFFNSAAAALGPGPEFPFCSHAWEIRSMKKIIPHSSAIRSYGDWPCSDVNQLVVPAAPPRSASPTCWRDTSPSAPPSSPTGPKVPSAWHGARRLLWETYWALLQITPLLLLGRLYYGRGTVDEKFEKCLVSLSMLHILACAAFWYFISF